VCWVSGEWEYGHRVIWGRSVGEGVAVGFSVSAGRGERVGVVDRATGSPGWRWVGGREAVGWGEANGSIAVGHGLGWTGSEDRGEEFVESIDRALDSTVEDMVDYCYGVRSTLRI
jgi:hypothetical protein